MKLIASFKTKDMKDQSEDNKDRYFPLFIKIALGCLAIAFIFPFTVNAFFSEWSKSGSFGDTFGALNAVFSGLALAGVIVTILIQRSELKNQRLELSLQRNEMKETRNEFLLNRTTTLVYNQLDRFEKALAGFSIKSHDGTIHKGHEAIIFLEENRNMVYNSPDKSKDIYKEEMKQAFINLLKIYTPNDQEIRIFAQNAYTSIEVLKRLIFKTELDISHLNDLKNLFFVNVGFINMGVIERISEVAESHFEYLEGKDYAAYKLELGSLGRSNILFQSIKEFYKLRLTKENFEEQKAIWIEEQGNLESP